MDAVAAGPAVSCSPSTCRLNCSYRHLGRSGPAGRKQVAGRNQSTVTHRREQRKVSGTSLAPTAASGRILLLPRPTANPVNCACLGSSIGQLHGLRSIHGVFFLFEVTSMALSRRTETETVDPVDPPAAGHIAFYLGARASIVFTASGLVRLLVHAWPARPDHSLACRFHLSVLI